MKHHITLFAFLIVSSLSVGQNKHIETQSVSINNFITFIVDHIENKQDHSEMAIDQITFLLQTPTGDLSIENKVVLKQAFKLISQRLTEHDNISIITYSGFSGIALNRADPKDLKHLLFTIENLKTNIKEFHKDGIELAYAHASQNYESNSKNSVIMIRNPDALMFSKTPVKPIENIKSKNANKNNNAVLLTAITLIPQLISVIKD